MLSFAIGFGLGVVAGHVFRVQISAGIDKALIWIRSHKWWR